MRSQILALIFAGLIEQPPASTDDAAKLTTLTLRLMRSRHGSEITIANPNNFPVFGVVASCDFKGRHGQVISSLAITIMDAVQANGTRKIRNFNGVDWPAEARTADCISLDAKRFPE